MFQFIILLYTSFKDGKRYAFRPTSTNYSEQVSSLHSKIESEFDDIGLSTHFGQTMTSKWEEVAQMDSYFKDVELIECEQEFLEVIRASEEITPLDIAQLIAMKVRCTPLKLQKLLYIAYCKFLKETDSPLFGEEFQAWDYGPVIPSVYHQFKSLRSEQIIIDVPTANEKRYLSTSIGRKILKVVDETIEQYGDYSANNLVTFTHEPGRAWVSVFIPLKSNVMSVECIKESLDFNLNV
ncbi:Panacea domain-containing protein [Exiguobacterium antarcticum]|uniref:Panacea domain-containing protein n=1 Tax=Exiguobacterium antarcticum TaxID=132920 RepID=UPI0004789618|nr:type II toxin-antitoxin system antitoxin SocA domain-containing protein [Exiguobacterium antarcticum]